MGNSQPPVVLDEPMESTFGSRLFRNVKAGSEDSIILSPLSIKAAILLAAVGSEAKTKSEFEALFCAQESNETQSETEDKSSDNTADDEKKEELPKSVNMDIIQIFQSMKNVCDFLNSKYTKLPIVAIANRIWVKGGYPLSSEYEETVSKSLVVSIDFNNASAAAKTINDWVEQKTRDKITDLIPAEAIDSDTRIIITNAVYFQALFAKEFKSEDTEFNQKFYSDYQRNETVSESVSIMWKEGSDELYVSNDNYDIVALPYKNCDIQLIIALPKNDRNETMTLADLKSAHSQLTTQQIKLGLPKFKIEKTYAMIPILQKMNLILPFGMDADFTGISPVAKKEGLYISEIIHKAMIEVDEKGTVAAAATAVVMVNKCAQLPRPMPTIVCNHPFDFFLFDPESKTVLFSGRYMGK